METDFGGLNMKNTLLMSVAAASLAVIAGSASATTLSATLNVDNGFTAYISTDDSVAGTSFLTGSSWPVSSIGSTALTAGVTNYLHIYAYDTGGPQGLLGTFSLSDTDFQFGNGTQTLLSGDSAMMVSETGWSGYHAISQDYGANGVAPWGFMAAQSASSHWVWSDGGDYAYFTVAIESTVPTIPLPASLPFLAVGLGMFGIARARRKQDRRMV